MYESSVGEKGGFASKVIGGVATGNAAKDGVISGKKAVEAFNAYMGPTGGIPAAAAVEEAKPCNGAFFQVAEGCDSILIINDIEFRSSVL